MKNNNQSICVQCNNNFHVHFCRFHIARFCSYKCYHKFRKGKSIIDLYGEEKAKSIKKKLSKVRKGKKAEDIYGSKQEAKKQIQKRMEARKLTYKNNPEIRINATKKMMQTIKNNPEIKINATKKMMQTMKENPQIRINQEKKRNQAYKNNPGIREQQNRTHRMTINDSIWKKKVGKYQAMKQSATKQGVSLEDWKGVIYKDPYDKRWTNNFKNQIRKRDNQVCMSCGMHREKLEKALNVHHINYNKKLTIPQNCISLCTSCHMRTNSNRKHWTTFFQSLLTERYNYKYENNQCIITFMGEKNDNT